jgi:hypothetical protein
MTKQRYESYKNVKEKCKICGRKILTKKQMGTMLIDFGKNVTIYYCSKCYLKNMNKGR